MTTPNQRPRLTTILPCNNLDAAETWFARLGFNRTKEDKARQVSEEDTYRILFHATNGSDVHLTQAVPGWVVADKNPFGLYLYVEDVDSLAAEFKDEIIEQEKRAAHKDWGMYGFALNGPDGVLVRVGWPSKLMKGKAEGQGKSLLL